MVELSETELKLLVTQNHLIHAIWSIDEIADNLANKCPTPEINEEIDKLRQFKESINRDYKAIREYRLYQIFPESTT